MPPDAWLGDAPHHQLLHEPTPRLDLTPRHVLQRDRPHSRIERLGRGLATTVATIMVHVAFAVAFFYLLSFRDPEAPREVEIPVEVVSEPPKPAAALKADSTEPTASDRVRQALAVPVAPDPKPTAPPEVQPPASRPATPPTAAMELPKLVAPPPEPSRAATQDRENKPADLEPDQHQVDQASHEARPVAVPRTLATTDPKAGFAVPAPLPPSPDPVAKPAPPIPVKAPSEADKLAAALPMDMSAMPMSFRAVLSGNGAQVSAAYRGLVYGRFSHSAEINERARQQHLKGQVVVSFSIDDAGQISQLAVLQTSGNAAVDALGLDMIRSAAPYPAPPPDAQRSFTPALSFGE